MFTPQSSKPDFTAIFESVHSYRSDNHIFQASVDKNPSDNQFRFYDGPPFVTGLPHYGHLASSVAKDVIPRFQTMKGKKVERVRGRDCHGIPIEQKVQTKLGLASNLDIEKVGIETFINGCYDYTRSVSGERKRYIDQFARWVDFDNSYKTMDNDYMESVRRVFKTLWDKGLIYKGKRVSLYSTKLETPISNFEVAMDDTYEEVNDPAITVMLDLSVNGPEYDNTFALIWTTTPWTIPVNIAAGVHKKIEYVVLENQTSKQKYIIAKNRILNFFQSSERKQNQTEYLSSYIDYHITKTKIYIDVMKDSIYEKSQLKEEFTTVSGDKYTLLNVILGEQLVGLSYKPPYDYLYGKTNNPNDHKIYHADFVSDTDGTGLVHEAPEFGEVDFQLAKQVGLTITEAMDSSGHMFYASPLARGIEGDQFHNPGSSPSLLTKEGAIFYRDANSIIIQELHDMGRLFHKASITHRVAFCPRSGTPLVYKAQDSWFIDINGPQEIFGGKSLKQKCIEANEDINRYPEHNKHGRFLKSLESAPDRCISRTRYWGTPMPIYKPSANSSFIKGGGEVGAGGFLVIGSREELFQLSKTGSKNIKKITLIRHGESGTNSISGTMNIQDLAILHSEGKSSLTELGIQQIIKLKKNIVVNNDTIYVVSPLLRTIQTLDILLGTSYATDTKYQEIYNIYHNLWDTIELKNRDTIQTTYKLSENVYIDFRIIEEYNHSQYQEKNDKEVPFIKRIQSFYNDFQKGIFGSDIAIIGHGGSTAILKKLIKKVDLSQPIGLLHTGNRETIYRNTTRDAELDLHRPFIDDVWFDKDSIRYERISEVLDCWVESASMPYAQVHYPFENKEKFDNSFPADYIVEYTGQIRAWFYVMHVLGVALFDKPAFKNVICHGVIAGNDGRKMSKSLGNFPDPKPTFAQYGGDAVRMSILTTPLFNGGDMNFSEDLILEALKQNILPLWNAFSFFVTYANIDKFHPSGKEGLGGDHNNTGSSPTLLVKEGANRLDTWILGELATVTQTIDHDLEHYDITHASRQIASFLENLTNWYIRRSRRRFWKSDSDEDKASAYATLYTVLTQFCIIAAPFMPIVTEYIWKVLTDGDINNSVHLQDYPDQGGRLINTSLQNDMNLAQTIVRMGLASRGKKNIRVRQPLSTLTLGVSLDQYYLDIIAEELNIKNLICDPSLNTHVTKICKPDGKIIGQLFGGATKEIFALAKSGEFVEAEDGSVVVGKWLLPAGSYEISYIKTDESEDIEVDNGIVMKIDWTITPELEREGYARDLIRTIQDARKEADYDIADRILLKLEGGSFAEDIINHHGATIQEETLSTIHYTDITPDSTKTVALGEHTIVFMLKR